MIIEHGGITLSPFLSPPPEIPKPSEISEAFQEVVTTKILKVVPEAFIVSGPRHHYSSKISEN